MNIYIKAHFAKNTAKNCIYVTKITAFVFSFTGLDFEVNVQSSHHSLRDEDSASFVGILREMMKDTEIMKL